MAPLQTTHILFAGDFKSILDSNLDSYNPQCTANLDLVHWAETFALTEICRWKHDNTKAFSHLSQRSCSRLDLSFSSSRVLTNISGALYLPLGTSDHSPLELFLDWEARGIQVHGAPRWIHNDNVVETVSRQIESYWSINEDTAFPLDAVGCF